MSNLIRLIPDLREKILNIVSVLSQEQNWGLGFVEVEEAWKHNKGENVKVAILDTGWSPHKDLINNFSQGYDATGNNNFIDNGNFHGCIFPADKIYTDKNGIIEIKNLYDEVTPDAVYICPKENTTIKLIGSADINTCSLMPDMEFNFSKIRCVHKLSYKGEIFKIKTNKKTILHLTPWHPVYTNNGKTRADELKIGTPILASYFENKIDELSVVFKNYFKCKYCGYTPIRGNGERKQCRNCNKYKWCESVEENIKITEKLGFWLGLILSDGHVMISSQSIEFCGNNENLVKYFEDLTFELFGKKCNRYADKRSSMFYRTRVHSRDIYDFVRFTCGINAGAKSLNIDVPKIIQKSSIDVVGAFYAGVIEGDGCVYGKRIRIATASKKFADTSRVLLKTLGVNCGIEQRTNINTNFSSMSDMFYLDVQASDYIVNHLVFKKFDYPVLKKRKYEIVKSIEIINYEGDLYDLTVANTHNYVANGLVVSNTHVAGIIAANSSPDSFGVTGLAPMAKLVPIKVLEDSGNGSYEFVRQGLEIVKNIDVDVVNMSLGASVVPSDDSLHQIIKEIVDQNKIIVCAAGNDGGSVNYPAKYDETIAVAAVQNDGSMAKFSSRGPELDTAAPGVHIYSTWGNNQYINLDGTSMAAPCISGIVSLIISWKKSIGKQSEINYKEMIKILQDIGSKDASHRIVAPGQYDISVPEFCNMKWE